MERSPFEKKNKKKAAGIVTCPDAPKCSILLLPITAKPAGNHAKVMMQTSMVLWMRWKMQYLWETQIVSFKEYDTILKTVMEDWESHGKLKSGSFPKIQLMHENDQTTHSIQASSS